MAWYDYPVGWGYITDNRGPNTDTPHYAYDLQTPFHTELTAPLAGTVKVADFQAWGGEVFVQPDNKSLPEYYMYHLDTETVHPGQHVNAGDELGLSGGQTSGGEHPAATRWSTGPHTHVGWWTSWKNGIPYGPEPANLIQAAKNLGVLSQVGNVPGSQTSFPIDKKIYDAVEPIAQQYGVPDAIWETVAMVESGGNPSAEHLESNGHYSIGLFQLEQGVGQGGVHSAQQLSDPKFNAQLGMPSIAAAYKQDAPFADTPSWWHSFAGDSGHPGHGEPAQTNEAQKLQGMYDAHVNNGFDPNSLNINGNTPAPTDPLTAIASFFSGIPGEIGGLLLRTGVGVVGALLIGFGTYEVVYAMKDSTASNSVVQSVAKPIEAAKKTAVNAAKVAVL